MRSDLHKALNPFLRWSLTVTDIQMSLLSVNQLRNLLDSLINEYKSLVDEKNKLDGDCQTLKDHIDNQVTLIRSLGSDFEKLRQEYATKRGEIAAGQAPREIDQIPTQSSAAPAAPAADDAEGQDFEFTPLVTPDAIEHPLIVSLFAEIVDVSVICSTDFSPDGTSLAIGSDRTLRVYDIEKDVFLFQYNIEDSESQNHIRSICWTNDGSQIICGGEDGKIRVLNLPIVSAPEQDQVRCFEAASGEVFQVCLSPDNSLLAAVSGNGALSLFKREDYSLICTLERDESNTVATALAISPDNKIIAVGYSDSYVGLWDAETHKQLAMEVLHSQGVYAVKFAPSPAPDRYRLVTGSLDNSVKILDLIPADDKIEFEVRNNMEGHSSFVLALAIDPTGEWLLSGSKDLTAKLSSLSTGQMIYSIKAHSNSVITVAFSPKGNMFCTGSGDHIVKIWSMGPEESEERA